MQKNRNRLSILAFLAALAAVGCGRSGALTEAPSDFSTSPGAPNSPPGATGAEPSFELGENPRLEDYLRLGLGANAGLRAAFERWSAATEIAPQVSSLPDPRLTWAVFLEQVETRTGPQRNRISLSQSFPWFGKLDLRGEAAEREARVLWWELESRRLALTRDIKQAFFEYGYLSQAIRVTMDNLKLLQQFEPIVQRRVQLGADQSDLLRLQIEIGKVENDLATLTALRPALSARLDAALNRRSAAPLPWPELASPEPIQLDAPALRERLPAENPELKALAERVNEKQLRLALARLERRPDFTFGLDFFETGRARSPGTRQSGDDPVALSLSMNLPIWRERYNAAEREAAASNRAAAEELTDRKHSLLADLELRIYQIGDSARRIALYRDTLFPRVRQTLQVTEVAYQAGRVGLIDVIDTQRELLEFEKSLWRATANYEQRLADLEFLTGGPLP